jgi:anti-sigma regulatory factor (Ser/Thr protein kinase)
MNERSEARLSVPADGEAMGRIRAVIERFGGEWRVRSDDVARIIIAVEELVTNMVKYGYSLATEPGVASIALRLEGDRLAVEIIDDGDEFDPFAAPEPDLEAPIEQRRIGGLGLHLVKTLMDETRYRRDGAHNVVEISRRVAFET